MIQPSPEILRKMVQREDSQSKQLDEMEKMVSSFDGQFWKTFVKRLQVRVNYIRMERETNFMASSELALKVSRAKEDELMAVMAMPKDIFAAHGLLKKENAAFREEIRKYRKKIKDAAL